MAELRIELLGGFRVTAGGRAIPEDVWRRLKTPALFKLLASAARERFAAAASLYERAGHSYWVGRSLAQAAAA
jgi:hypothetical protein